MPRKEIESLASQVTTARRVRPTNVWWQMAVPGSVMESVDHDVLSKPASPPVEEFATSTPNTSPHDPATMPARDPYHPCAQTSRRRGNHPMLAAHEAPCLQTESFAPTHLSLQQTVRRLEACATLTDQPSTYPRHTHTHLVHSRCGHLGRRPPYRRCLESMLHDSTMQRCNAGRA